MRSKTLCLVSKWMLSKYQVHAAKHWVDPAFVQNNGTAWRSHQTIDNGVTKSKGLFRAYEPIPIVKLR